jgi:hypothetical protein
MTPTREGQTYKFGWFVASSSLAQAINPQLIKGLGDAFGLWGTVFATMVAGWFLAIGISAVAVRPWSWYVLLAAQWFLLVWGGLYIAFVAIDWNARAWVAVSSVGVAMIYFVYFYKRRSLFRARWRWEWLERSWPRLIGPETISPDARPGYGGLSPLRQALFTAATAILAFIHLLT